MKKQLTVILAVLTLVVTSCASRNYKYQTPKKHRRCGDCPRFTTLQPEATSPYFVFLEE
jgi:hypothetical protein